jgi:hypothetical protein
MAEGVGISCSQSAAEEGHLEAAEGWNSSHSRVTAVGEGVEDERSSFCANKVVGTSLRVFQIMKFRL